MTVAMWSERRYAQVAVFAGASLLFAVMAARGSSFGYVEDRRSLGQRNGLIGGWSWIDLDDVVALSDGRQPLVSTRYLVLWSRTSQSDLWGARLARFTVRTPQHVRYGEGLGGELHPFRIVWSGRCSAAATAGGCCCVCASAGSRSTRVCCPVSCADPIGSACSATPSRALGFNRRGDP
jgi:hypothetical protein